VNPAAWSGVLAYLVVFVGPIVETEVVIVGACVLVSVGKLNAWGVLVAGALGGSAADQMWYYVLKGRLAWLKRLPVVARRHDAVIARVRRHAMLMPVAVRFLPGLRIAIAAACAYANIPPLQFTLLNMAASFVWTAAILVTVLWAGPAFVQTFGLQGWWGFVVPAVLFVLFFRWLARSSGLESEAREQESVVSS
jgi:membrane protein DedA with SNARE-associated domain